MRNHLLVIDPGLDAMGCAVFDLDVDPREPEAALLWVETVRTLTTDSLAFRLKRLGGGATSAAMQFACTHAVVELPSFTGTYARNRGKVGRDGMAANMAKLNLAIGYIAATLEARTLLYFPVEFVAPVAMRKDLKTALAKRIVTAAEKRQKVTLSGRTPSADALDAVALGASLLGRLALTPPITAAATQLREGR